MRFAHTRISLADIISRPVAFDLSSLFKSENSFNYLLLLDGFETVYQY